MIFLLGQHSTLKQNCFSSNYNEFFSAGKWVVVLRFSIFWSTLSMHGDDDNLKMIRCAWVKASPKLNFFSFSQFWFVPHQSDHHNQQFGHHNHQIIIMTWHYSDIPRHYSDTLNTCCKRKISSGEEVPLRRLGHAAPSWPCQLPYWHHKVWSLSAINSIVTFFFIFFVTIGTEVIDTIIALIVIITAFIFRLEKHQIGIRLWSSLLITKSSIARAIHIFIFTNFCLGLP